MKPLRPINHVQPQTAQIKKLVPSEQILAKGKVPITVDTEVEALAYEAKYNPPRELATFGELKFMSESIYLVSNDAGRDIRSMSRCVWHITWRM